MDQADQPTRHRGVAQAAVVEGPGQLLAADLSPGHRHSRLPSCSAVLLDNPDDPGHLGAPAAF
jgi:hypothetical protein